MLESKKPLVAKTALKAKSKLTAKSTPSKQKKPSITKLKKEADKLFSQYVRLRDNNVCITCGGVGNQAGHFQSRRYNATRFNEQNTNAQCFRCNVLFYGEQYKYATEIDLKYGKGTAAKLTKLAKVNHPFTIEELQQIIDNAKAEIAWYDRIKVGEKPELKT